MVTIVNISGGIVSSDMLHLRLNPGARVELAGSSRELIAVAPDLIDLIQRKHIMLLDNEEELSNADA